MANRNENNFDDEYNEADPDAGWQPSRRPQSKIARDFEAELHKLFVIDNSVDEMAKTVYEKKFEVTMGNDELEQLERRLRETEERLKATKAGKEVTSTGSQRRSDKAADQADGRSSTRPQTGTASSSAAFASRPNKNNEYMTAKESGIAAQ